jgi:hypothetical protein
MLITGTYVPSNGGSFVEGEILVFLDSKNFTAAQAKTYARPLQTVALGSAGEVSVTLAALSTFSAVINPIYKIVYTTLEETCMETWTVGAAATGTIDAVRSSKVMGMDRSTALLFEVMSLEQELKAAVTAIAALDVRVTALE